MGWPRMLSTVAARSTFGQQAPHVPYAPPMPTLGFATCSMPRGTPGPTSIVSTRTPGRSKNEVVVAGSLVCSMLSLIWSVHICDRPLDCGLITL